jgi:hypothetical protein
MSLNDDLWSVETPPRVFSPKRQKMEPEITIKIEYFLDNVYKDHFHHVSLLQIIFNSPINDAKILNKRCKVLKENAILALCDAQIHQIITPSTRKLSETSIIKRLKLSSTIGSEE